MWKRRFLALSTFPSLCDYTKSGRPNAGTVIVHKQTAPERKEPLSVAWKRIGTTELELRAPAAALSAEEVARLAASVEAR